MRTQELCCYIRLCCHVMLCHVVVLCHVFMLCHVVMLSCYVMLSEPKGTKSATWYSEQVGSFGSPKKSNPRKPQNVGKYEFLPLRLKN